MTRWAPQPGPQTEAICANWCEELFYGGAAGGGKGQPLDALVLTPFGYKRMDEIKVGSAVCNPDGSIAAVIAIYPLGERQIFRVEFHDGTFCEVTDDHIWLTWLTNRGKKRNGDREHGEASARLSTTARLIEAMKKGDRPVIPITQCVTFNDVARYPRRPVDPYLLGVLLGDGSITKAALRISCGDPEIIDRIKLRTGLELRTYTSATRTTEYRLREPNNVRKHLERWGLIGCVSDDKFIPPSYLLGSDDERWELLRGLMDTDGWADKDGDVYYCTISPRLYYDVAALARSVGAFVTIRAKNARAQNGRGSRAYTLRIKLRSPDMAFALERKRAKCRGRVAQSMGRRIVSITPARMARAQCIKVSHPNGLYLTNDFIVTHNTDFLLADYLQDVEHFGAAWQGILFRRSMPELEEIMARAQEMYPSTGGVWREQNKRWSWPNGAKLRLRYLEADRDATRYQGGAYTWIGWDELGQHPTPFGYKYLRGRLRSAHPVSRKRIRSSANPGGVGHHWLKAKFVSPAPLGGVLLRDPDTHADVMFIRAKLTDNKILMQNDPLYAQRLKGMGSEALVRAWLDGDWDIIAGAFFSEFTADRHVVRAHELPDSWPRFRSGDWGSFRPFAFHWWAISDGSDARYPRGALVCYREWYGWNGNPNEGLKMTAEAVGAGIAEREAGEKINNGASVLDPSAFSSDGGPSIAERLHLGSGKKIDFRRADNKRVAKVGAIGGWDQVRSRLIGEERPMIYFFDTCTEIIRTLPVLQHDELKPEDVDTEGEDHAPDSVRYACMSRPYLRRDQPKLEPVFSGVHIGAGRPPPNVRVPTFDEMWRDHERENRR